MERLLVIGFGDVATRALPVLAERYRVAALVRNDAAAASLTSRGVTVFRGDLDDPASLGQLAGAAECILHLAPPNDSGDARDRRTRDLVAALDTKPRGAMLPRRVVYISTSGVYGDCGGAYVDEDRPVNPGTARAARRVDAENVLQTWGERHGVDVIVLRVPGIYASDRLPLERLKRGTPALRADEDVYTNHIHADDLAAICAAALERGRPGAVYNASDDTELKMGDYFDLVADRSGLPRPPRVSRAEAERVIPAMLLSFMSESRRLVNRRMKDELGVRLRYPTVYDGVPTVRAMQGA